MTAVLWLLAGACFVGWFRMMPVTRAEAMDVRAPYRLVQSLIYLVLAWLAASAAVNTADAATVRVPEVDAHVRLLVEQAAAEEWGVNASPARLAAQLHQESGWHPRAHSGVGAQGLAQFMPQTGQWLAATFPDVGAYDPWDPAWSVRAAAVYDHWLLVRNPGDTVCSSWAFTFSAYNGGERLLHREQGMAKAHGHDPLRWFASTADERARTVANWQQNRQYVRHILVVLEPAYIAAGWPGEAVCG